MDISTDEKGLVRLYSHTQLNPEWSLSHSNWNAHWIATSLDATTTMWLECPEIESRSEHRAEEMRH